MLSFNLEMAIARVGGDRTLFQELARLFLDDYPKTLLAVQESLANHDRAALEHHAHSLKGAAMNFDAPDVVQAARSLELGSRNEPEAALSQGLKTLETALAKLDSDLRTITES